MQTFAAVVDVTDAEVQNAQEFTATWGEIRQQIGSLGGEVKETYALLGEHDFLVVYEAADVDDALKLSLAVQQYGMNMETMVAIPVEEMGELVDDI